MRQLDAFWRLARNWEALGDADPLFGVLSDPTKQHGRWQTDEFLETGRAHVRKLLRILGEHGVTYDRGTCLDFGCGPGRLTIPLSEVFARTVGVDVAKSMVAAARRLAGRTDRCEFLVNRRPDLGQFKDASFDVVHSCLVLQHIPPDVTKGYIAEFLRVARPGGLVVFQLPAETLTDAQISAVHALPDAGYRAHLAIVDAPPSVEASARFAVRVAVTNRSPVAWSGDIPAGRHICLANHWLDAAGAVAVPDDGRSRLTMTLAPDETQEMSLVVQAPSVPGRYVLDVDLVQEQICWFAQKGSPTGPVPIDVGPSSAPPPKAPAPVPPPRVSWMTRLRRRLQGGTPTFEMHVVPRAAVEQVVTAKGGRLLHAIEDNAAGERWLSYTYVVRRRS